MGTPDMTPPDHPPPAVSPTDMPGSAPAPRPERAPHPGRGYLTAAWVTLGIAGMVGVLYLLGFGVLTAIEGGFWVFVGLLAFIPVTMIIIAIGCVAIGFFALARSRRLGPVRGQAAVLSVTFVGLPASIAIVNVVSAITDSAVVDALMILAVLLTFGLVIFCATWSLWGPRVAPTGQAPTAA